ncbi:Sec-independent protein translocase TatD [[Leptolyngbya] sp. PCC 7376]|uniref:TatD family hydrolase n=1 Tax=[Leptolyngbya] sp. PCC 7376 TaxID=111781 RepID=UPI00029F4D4F|nr:TatD family hydrolase [[Leptolyngbya] sp. PCC 7376]AFY38725.1 Sec-independent protein translocase TatD [[Leptolyngbya] sp. PCC 7376]
MQLVDTHVHINFDVFQDDIDLVAQRWRDANVAHLVHSCVEPSEFPVIRSLADRFPELKFSVGLHPLDADKWTEGMAAEIRDYAKSDRRVVAIGELGLDFFKADNQQHQIHVLESQLEVAAELDLPIIVHCRDAAPEFRQVVENFVASGRSLRGVMHCWTGTPEETQWFLDLGFYVSFSGVVTFKNAVQVKESALLVPNERLLIETDCPFLAPVPKRGKRNEPAFVQHVATYLAELRGTALDTLARQTTLNASELFRFAL